MRLPIFSVALLLLAHPACANEEQTPVIKPDRTAKIAFINSITQQIKPFWHAPAGAEVEKLVVTLKWDIDGTSVVVGQPQVTSVEGVTEKNRKKVTKYISNAIKVILNASPFHLPPEYKNVRLWRGITVRFDRKIPPKSEH